MMQNYDMKIQEKAERVFSVMEKRVSAQDVERIRAAFELAKTAHADQKLSILSLLPTSWQRN